MVSMLRRISILINIFLSSQVSCGGFEDFFDHVGKPGTQLGRDRTDPNYYSTNSDMPHLPFITGFHATHGTQRFIMIAEQTAIMIGEPKHGVWRVQDNGFVREYRKKGKVGLPDGVNPNDPVLSSNDLDIIKNNYDHYLPDESWSGYKYPDDKISDGSYDGMKGYLNYIDLTIYNSKYGGRYNDHIPIDLPHWYCTMTQNDYPYVNNSWIFARAQPMANKIGPLGRRAGLDIKENYLNVLKLSLFPDAFLWLNVGVGNLATDVRVKNLNELKSRAQTVNHKKVDFSKVHFEMYLIERLFFNKPYLFITAIFENKDGASEVSYVRPSGAYWEGLKTHGQNTSAVGTTPNYYPKFPVLDYPVKDQSSIQTIRGVPLYGLHNPNRKKFKLGGGACPNRGGDWGRYPWSNSGAGWPTNYEEITPLCDAAMIDVKFWTNLWAETWADESLGVANAGFKGENIVEFTADANIYGRYTDPYLKKVSEVNPFELDLTTSGKMVEAADRKPNPVAFKVKYNQNGTAMSYNAVDIYKTNVQAQCDEPTDKKNTTTSNKEKVITTDNDDDIPDWGIAVLVLLSVLVIINLLAIVTYFCCSRGSEYAIDSISNGRATSGIVNKGVELK